MIFQRSAGILLHPSSLPGEYGIGDLGPNAFAWLDFLASCDCSLWQVLPLGPTGYGDSPYQCFSAFAGNPYLISPAALLADGLLQPDDLFDKPHFPSEKVDYGRVIQWKIKLLDRAFARFQESTADQLIQAYQSFQHDHCVWLNDFALFMAIKDAHGGAPWTTWEPSLRSRQEPALDEARRGLDSEIQKHTFRQFLFFRQWQALRTYAHQKGILIIGDIPIFVAHDSADVWANPELFNLYPSGMPAFVAGVPPDYFSATGQLWGNPLYRWRQHKKQDFRWWIERLRSVLQLVDYVRIDHFRGFAGYWQIPGNADTAIDGRWVKGPGEALFLAIQKALGKDLPIIAEDLGVITPDVVSLRDTYHLPGMKIIQFGFEGGAADAFLPHNYATPHCVVYTGTHDNDTALGWFERVDKRFTSFYKKYTHRDGTDVSWDMIRLAWGSTAVFALAPLQDFLSLGNAARMNYPGNPSGNWTWRMPAGALTLMLAEQIKELNELYSRS